MQYRDARHHARRHQHTVHDRCLALWRIIRTEGKDALLKAIAASDDHWAVLRPLGIMPENLTVVLKEELEKPIAFTL